MQQIKDALSHPNNLKELLQTSNDGSKVRYNKDLLPSPPGECSRSLDYLVKKCITDLQQRIGAGNGNTISPTT
jgi:hypothetical protein